MKTIINQPITGVRHFHCGECESEFDAWEDEYNISSSKRFVRHRGGSGFLGFLKTILVYQPTKEISCECPVCDSECVIEIDWGGEYEEEYYDPS